MTRTDGTLTSRDGTELFFQHWQIDGPTKAVLCLVHGLGEHSGRYDHVAETFNAFLAVVQAEADKAKSGGDWVAYCKAIDAHLTGAGY